MSKIVICRFEDICLDKEMCWHAPEHTLDERCMVGCISNTYGWSGIRGATCISVFEYNVVMAAKRNKKEKLPVGEQDSAL